MGSVDISPEVSADDTTTIIPDPAARWRNYQHILWSQQQIHLQIQQQHQQTPEHQPTNEKTVESRAVPVPVSKDDVLLGEELGKDIDDPWEQLDAHSAFLGPTLWDKRVGYDGHDFKLEYVDLEEFLTENGIPVDDSRKANVLPRPTTPEPGFQTPLYPPRSECGKTHRESGSMSSEYASTPSSPLSCSSMTTDSIPSDPISVPDMEFDPRRRMFSTEELKPQPMIKKSKKQYVPDDAKDAKYWVRRRKNNMAAKRSRDARRMKENQIAMRACYLEKENQFMKQELERVQKENKQLKDQLTQFTYPTPQRR